MIHCAIKHHLSNLYNTEKTLNWITQYNFNYDTAMFCCIGLHAYWRCLKLKLIIIIVIFRRFQCKICNESTAEIYLEGEAANV